MKTSWATQDMHDNMFHTLQRKRIRPTSLRVQSFGSLSTKRTLDSRPGTAAASRFLKELGGSLLTSRMVWDVRWSCLWVGSFRGDGNDPLMLGPAAAVAAIASKPYAPGCKEFICKAKSHNTNTYMLVTHIIIIINNNNIKSLSKICCLHLCWGNQKKKDACQWRPMLMMGVRMRDSPERKALKHWLLR